MPTQRSALARPARATGRRSLLSGGSGDGDPHGAGPPRLGCEGLSGHLECLAASRAAAPLDTTPREACRRHLAPPPVGGGAPWALRDTPPASRSAVLPEDAAAERCRRHVLKDSVSPSTASDMGPRRLPACRLRVCALTPSQVAGARGGAGRRGEAWAGRGVVAQVRALQGCRGPYREAGSARRRGLCPRARPSGCPSAEWGVRRSPGWGDLGQAPCTFLWAAPWRRVDGGQDAARRGDPNPTGAPRWDPTERLGGALTPSRRVGAGTALTLTLRSRHGSVCAEGGRALPPERLSPRPDMVTRPSRSFSRPRPLPPPPVPPRPPPAAAREGASPTPTPAQPPRWMG